MFHAESVAAPAMHVQDIEQIDEVDLFFRRRRADADDEFQGRPVV